MNVSTAVQPGRASPVAVRDLLRLALGLILGGIALWLALRGAAIGGLRSALGRADVFWILLALGSVLLTLAVAVVRWRILFHPESAGLSWGNLAAAFLVGQMLNIMLPLRLGEVARGYWLSRSEGIPLGRALGTIGVEKLADLASIGLAAVALVVLAAVPPWVQAPGRVLVITGALAVAGILVLAASRSWLLQSAARVAQRWPRPVGGRVIEIVETILQGSRAVHSWKASVSVGLLSILVPLLAASTNYLLFVAFRLPLPLVAALLLLISLQVANTLVSVPGTVGVFHYVTVLTLGAYSVDHDTALAYALVLYIVALVPKFCRRRADGLRPARDDRRHVRLEKSRRRRLTGRALQRSDHKAVIFIGDLAALAAAVVTALWLWSITAGFGFSPSFLTAHAIWFLAVPAWTLALAPAYGVRISLSVYDTIVRLVQAAALLLGAYLALYFYSPRYQLPRLMGLYVLWDGFLLVLAWRLIFAWFFSRDLFARRVLIVGAGEPGLTALRLLRDFDFRNSTVVALLDAPGARAETTAGYRAPSPGSIPPRRERSRPGRRSKDCLSSRRRRHCSNARANWRSTKSSWLIPAPSPISFRRWSNATSSASRSRPCRRSTKTCCTVCPCSTWNRAGSSHRSSSRCGRRTRRWSPSAPPTWSARRSGWPDS